MYTHGDKLMALFGAPTAHEDDPLRAVRCALELESALEQANNEITNLLAANEEQQDLRNRDQATNSGSRFSILGSRFFFEQKIGINTGTVFAGRVGGAKRYSIQ